jgi:bacterioferritin B
MIISKDMNAAINTQIGNEFGAMLQYVAIAAYFSGEGLAELAAHFNRQAEEERLHAMRFVKYLLDAGGAVSISEIPSPRSRFQSAAEAVQYSLGQERTVTNQINDLVELAIKESDHATKNILNWFVDEQLEEVSSMDQLLKVIERAGENNLLYVEDHLARSKTKPAGTAFPAS